MILIQTMLIVRRLTFEADADEHAEAAQPITIDQQFS